MGVTPALPSPPVSPSSGSSSPRNGLETPDQVARLDSLLEIYLNRLDTYQKLRDELSKNFAAGFLSLAHANRTSQMGSGRRYGEEGYDERMKTGRRVLIRMKDGEDLVKPSRCDVGGRGRPEADPTPESILWAIGSISPHEADSAAAATSPTRTETGPGAPDHSSVGPSANLESKTPDSGTASISSEATPIPTFAQLPDRPQNQSTNSSRRSRKPVNPLHWYGVLVPPSLRAAQSSFAGAVEDQIPRLLTVQAEMENLEMQIRQLRIEAGLSQGTQHEVGDPNEDSSRVCVEAGPTRAFSRAGIRPQRVADAEDGKYQSEVKTAGRGRRGLSSPRKAPPCPRVLKVDG